MTNAHLLLVDDDPEMGVIVGVLARKAGQRLTRYRDVESAWQALAKARPDLILLDVNLPGESGLTLLSRLRAEEGRADLRVALFCQATLSRDVAAGWAAGADYLLPKDLVCQPAAWAERLRDILAHADGRLEVAPVNYLAEANGPRGVHWAEAMRQAGADPLVRGAGAEVIEQVAARARAHGFDHDASPDPAAPVTATPEQVQRVLTSFVEQVWCLLGPRASQACAGRLRAALAAGNKQSTPRNGRA